MRALSLSKEAGEWKRSKGAGMQNRMGLVFCAFALLMGFLMICLGAFFISSGSIFNCRGNLILAYMLLPLGFVILLSGIFWSTYRQASKSKGVFTHVLRRHLSHGALPLATVDRYVLRGQRMEEGCNGTEFWKSRMNLTPLWSKMWSNMWSTSCRGL